ncbi:hypothetical protein GOV05_05850 [Candidatus Woesearchaeota archaeon]|nr:hypothetical protein [Candidatus Woesearchaeota archaeon]
MVDLIIIGVLAISLVLLALPLNLAVKMLGGTSTIFGVLIVHVIVGVLYVLINLFAGGLASLLSFIAMLFIYKKAFYLSWFRAFLAWILAMVVMALISAAAALILGVSLLATLI